MPKRKRPARPSQRSRNGIQSIPGGGHKPAWIPEDPNQAQNVRDEVACEVSDTAMTRSEYYAQYVDTEIAEIEEGLANLDQAITEVQSGG